MSETASNTEHITAARAPSAPSWHVLSADAALARLGSRQEGLEDEEAERRLAEHGPNEVEQERETPWWTTLLRQFKDPLIYILLVAALVTFILRDYTDTGVILAVVVLNAAIGFVQERKAEQAMRALMGLSALRAEVIRNGRPRSVPSRELVPGDVVVLASGVRVPADLRLLRVQGLEVDESALTGESVVVAKTTDALEEETLVAGDQRNMAFAGTVVTRGRGRGVVVRTGALTEVGQIARAVRELGQTETPLQEKVHRLGRQVGVIILLLAFVAAAAGLARAVAPTEIFVAAVALVVSAVPEGLPVVLTVAFAVGVARMARRNAIVRSLPAVETLGSTTVIGSDKTGTLTKNEMTVRVAWAGGKCYSFSGVGYEATGAATHDGRPVRAAEDEALRWVLRVGVLANEGDEAFLEGEAPVGDPTETALLAAAAKAGLAPRDARARYREIDAVPFESEQRFMATLHEGPEGRFIFMKGAPEAVLARCGRYRRNGRAAALDADEVRQVADRMAEEGMRVLAMAYRPFDGERLTDEALADEALADEALADGFVLAGLQGMEDPVRPEAIEAVAEAQRAGVRVVMLTGDHAVTARAIGRQLGIAGDGGGVVEGRDIEVLSDDELDALLRETNVFARVAPEHKLRIVQRLKTMDHVVAVTGDGVNDAPALRAAHLGIAMGRGGTDVAREAADMVLADDNFATITSAIEEGRVVFSNVRKVTFFLLSTAVGEIITILLALLAGWPLPFVAAQILWVNLVTNGLQDVALAFEPGEPGLLRRPPRPPGENIVNRRLIERLGGVGAVLAAGTLGMFWYALEHSGDLEYARTVAVTQMVIFQFFHVFNSRSLDRSILSVPLFSNRFLFASVFAAVAAHLAVLHVGFLQAVFRTVPIGVEDWGLIVLVGTTVILGGELDKWRNRRMRRPLG